MSVPRTGARSFRSRGDGLASQGSEPDALKQSPLVLLHGIGTGPGAWEPQIEALSAEREVLAPDLVPAYRRGLECAVGEVLDLVSELPATHLCGISMGGLVALRVAAERGHDEDRLTLCAAFERLPVRLRRRVRVLALAARVMPRGLLHRQLVADLPEAHRETALAEIAPFRSAQISQLMWEAAGAAVDCAAIGAPALVACGEHDQANLPLAKSLAESLPHASLKIIADAGHVANLDSPQVFSALLRGR